MPATGTVKIPVSAEPPCTTPEVSINGAFYDYCTCMSIENNSGIVPGKALIRIGGNGYDVRGNITLNAYQWADMIPGARVVIADGAEILFVGSLRKRRDTGEPNTIMWEAWDDRFYLSKIPIRGCLVYDPTADKVKYLSRYICRVNPQGYRNCVTVSIPGLSIPVPVFLYAAEAHAGYDNSDFDQLDVLKQPCDWTPLKFIKYLWALANLGPGDVDGLTADHWRSLAGSTRLRWLASANELLTTDVVDNKEMLRKMPDQTFQGQYMLKVLCDTLDQSGAFGFKIGVGDVSNGGQVSDVSFFARDMSYADGGTGNTLSIPLLRGGDVSDWRTACDFDLDEDGSEVCESALGEGGPVRVEFQFANAWDSSGSSATWHGGTPQGIDDVLQRSFDDDDQEECAAIINGWRGQTDTRSDADKAAHPYALYPLRLVDKTKGQKWASVPHEWADGNNGRPLVRANTKEAVQLMREILPHVWRTFILNTRLAWTGGALKGADSKFADDSKYPIGYFPRPILPEQLQYFVYPPSSESAGKWTRAHYPVRIQVYDGTQRHTCEYNNGLRPNHDGTFSFDGLTDDIGNASDRIYMGGTMQGTPHLLVMRQIFVNAAVPLDHRVRSVANDASGQIDAAEAKELGGGLMLYMDSPEGFKEHHQVNSNPSAISEYPDNSGATVTGPLNRILEDDSDTSSNKRLNQALMRKLKEKRYVKRTSNWTMIGIRTEYQIGQFVSKITVQGQANDTDYILNAPIERYTWDFHDQVTRIGGLIATTGKRGQQAKLFMNTENAQEHRARASDRERHPEKHVTTHEGGFDITKPSGTMSRAELTQGIGEDAPETKGAHNFGTD